MANVYRCDVCSAIYEHHNEGVGPRGTFSVHEFGRPYVDGARIDCCPNCTSKLNMFIDILKEGLPYRIYVDGPKGGGNLDG